MAGRTMSKRIGILAIQGAFREHGRALNKLGVETLEIRSSQELDGIEGLIIPGGESTAIGKQLENKRFGAKITELAAQGLPVFGTCAGLILLSKKIDQSSQYTLGLMDTIVKRNAFGRQVASFEADIPVRGLPGGDLRAVFIRAPFVLAAEPNVEVLAEYHGKIVFVRQRNLLASAFHPELTSDLRVHEYFLQMVSEYKYSSINPILNHK